MEKEKMLEVLRGLFPEYGFDECSADMKCFGCFYRSNTNGKWFCRKSCELVSEHVLAGGECLLFAGYCPDIDKCFDITVSTVAPLFNLDKDTFLSKMACQRREREEAWGMTVYLMREVTMCAYKDITKRLHLPFGKVLSLYDSVLLRMREDEIYREKVQKLEEEIYTKATT